MNSKVITVAGLYTLHDVIGQGAFGKVYSAKRKRQSSLQDIEYLESAFEIDYESESDLNSDKLLAIKVQLSTIESEKEMTICQKLMINNSTSTIPGIPKFISCGQTGKFTYLVMERLGPSLEGPLNLMVILKLTLQLLNILAYLHSLGIIHGDLKPANMLFGATPETCHQIHLIDYGLSFGSGAASGNGGTFRYASANSHEPGHVQRTQDDLESLVFVMYYLFQGTLPWQGITDIPCVKELKKTFHIQILATAKKFPSEYLVMLLYVRQNDKINNAYLKNLFLNVYKLHTF